MTTWHILTCEYPPDVGGVSDYTRLVADALVHSGEEVHVWCSAGAPPQADSGPRVHREAGRFSVADLRRLSSQLDQFPAPRRLFVQWVPHGFGWHSMNLGLCVWLARRAANGDRVEVMVHEPFMEFRLGPARHVLMAALQRLMMLVLLRCASRVWVAIPAWVERLRPFLLGRPTAIEWLPVPGCLSAPASSVSAIRERYVVGSQSLIGHFGSCGREVSALLEDRLMGIMGVPVRPALLLIGSGSDRLAAELLVRHPDWAGRVHATGYVADVEVAGYLDACDLLVQPYPDGITSRRTSAMAGLSRGCPIVSTSGHLTEPLWQETGAVVLVPVSDAAGFTDAVTRLLRDPLERQRVARLGQHLYGERFALTHTLAALLA